MHNGVLVTFKGFSTKFIIVRTRKDHANGGGYVHDVMHIETDEYGCPNNIIELYDIGEDALSPIKDTPPSVTSTGDVIH